MKTAHITSKLQYVMDSRTQILYTYSVSADDRLARKCIDDLARAQRYETATLNCSYPNCNPNIIPGFSIYYIVMIYDHMMYFGDHKLVEKYMPTVERILQFFEEHLSEKGYVGKTGGLIMEEAFWSFIDWAQEWNPTSGMPPAGLKGPITMESLLYIYGPSACGKTGGISRKKRRSITVYRTCSEGSECSQNVLYQHRRHGSG